MIKRVRETRKEMEFCYVGTGSGYVFDVDKDGRLVLTDANRANYYKARLAVKHGAMYCKGVHEIVTVTKYLVVTCPVCGRKVEIYRGSWAYGGSTCECGAVFDEYGTLIADKDGKIDYDEPYDTADYY